MVLGLFSSQRCMIFPFPSLLFALVLLIMVTSYCRHTCCGPLFPRWHNIAHVALQNYSVHDPVSPKLQKQTCIKQGISESPDFLRVNFHSLNSIHYAHAMHEPLSCESPHIIHASLLYHTFYGPQGQ